MNFKKLTLIVSGIALLWGHSGIFASKKSMELAQFKIFVEKTRKLLKQLSEVEKSNDLQNLKNEIKSRLELIFIHPSTSDSAFEQLEKSFNQAMKLAQKRIERKTEPKKLLKLKLESATKSFNSSIKAISNFKSKIFRKHFEELAKKSLETIKRDVNELKKLLPTYDFDVSSFETQLKKAMEKTKQ